MQNKEKEALYNKLEQDILSSGLTYGEVMDVLGRLGCTYSDKGKNLLNSAKIQEVSRMGRF